MTQAAIYTRISSDREDTKAGVERQQKDCRDLCAERGWSVSEVFEDNNVSATSGAVRPQYQRMLKALERGQIDAIAVWNLDRLIRRPIELEQFVAACDRAGVTQVAFVGGGVDVGTGDGLLVARIMGAVAAEEARKTSQRIKRKHLDLAQKGLPNGGGTRPFGFKDDRKTVNEAEAALIREAADHVLADGSLRSIRVAWTERHVPTVTGKPWSVTAIKKILIRPRTAGLRQRGDIDNWSWDWPADWKAILDRATWEQVRAILTDLSRRQPPPSRDYPLGGVLHCAECGRHLTAMPRASRRNYGCRKESSGCGHVFVAADHVEKYVFDILLPLADSPDLRDTILGEEEGQKKKALELLASIRRDESKLVGVENARFLEENIDDQTFQRLSAELQKRIDTGNSRLAALRGKSALDRLGGHVQENWGEMSAEDRKLIILSLVSTIEVFPVKHRGSNVFDPSRLRIIFRYESVSKMAGPWIDAHGKFHFWGTVKVDSEGMTHGFEGDLQATKRLPAT